MNAIITIYTCLLVLSKQSNKAKDPSVQFSICSYLGGLSSSGRSNILLRVSGGKNHISYCLKIIFSLLRCCIFIIVYTPSIIHFHVFFIDCTSTFSLLLNYHFFPVYLNQCCPYYNIVFTQVLSLHSLSL